MFLKLLEEANPAVPLRGKIIVGNCANPAVPLRGKIIIGAKVPLELNS